MTGGLSPSLFVLEVHIGDQPYGGVNSHPYVRFWGVSQSGQEIMSEWMCLNSPGTMHVAKAVDRYAFTWRSDVRELYRIDIQLRRINDDLERTVPFDGFRLYSFDKTTEDWSLACDFGAREITPLDVLTLTSGTFTPFYSQCCAPGKPMIDVGRPSMLAQLRFQQSVARVDGTRSPSGEPSVEQVGGDKALHRLLQAGCEHLAD
jgi:hypothetical protein